MIGSRKRKVIRNDGTEIVLIIRRLYCPECRHVHHELPDCIVPYKRYSASAIETALRTSRNDQTDDSFSGENSTIIRLKIWFSLLRQYFEGVLRSIRLIHHEDKKLTDEINSMMPIDPLHAPPGWLSKIVQKVVNAGRWIQTRSALNVRS